MLFNFYIKKNIDIVRGNTRIQLILKIKIDSKTLTCKRIKSNTGKKKFKKPTINKYIIKAIDYFEKDTILFVKK